MSLWVITIHVLKFMRMMVLVDLAELDKARSCLRETCIFILGQAEGVSQHVGHFGYSHFGGKNQKTRYMQNMQEHLKLLLRYSLSGRK